MAEHILMALFSHSGNTHHIASLIQKKLDGTLFEIKPKDPYPE